MPHYAPELQSFLFGEVSIKLWVPAPEAVQHRVSLEPEGATFPYWAKLWPAAIALSRFITANPALVAHKKVLELAGGLGLPGMVAAHCAHEVMFSDYVPDAVTMMQASIALNSLTNTTCRLIDWYALPGEITADVLLLSDVNYDPAAFEVLYRVLKGFLDRDTTIILSTPQRLMARPFMERLLPYCIKQEEMLVDLKREEAWISVLVLRSR